MGTTTNLSITYPAPTDLVANGATDMQTIAEDIDDYFGAWTSYTPTGTNITGGTYSAAYRRMGKIGMVRVNITAGTATAAGSVAVSLPSGWTPTANGGACAMNATSGLFTVLINASTSVLTVYNGTGVANFAAAASLTNTRIGPIVIELT